MKNVISIKGAREHNLQNINLDIPKDKLNVITGVSGSGKSSLAFDTIYAEGQRRYVESLSAYARQFLGIMDKPDVDTIDGLSPAISIDQKTTSHNPRSTVGTITEIYDYMRLMFARVGHPHCPNDGREIVKMSVDEIVEKILARMKEQASSDKIKPRVFSILSPIVRQKKGEFKELFDNLRSKGYAQVIIDGTPYSINDEVTLIKTNKHSVSLVVDDISTSYKNLNDEAFVANLRSRLTNDIEQSTSLSDGLVILRHSHTTSRDPIALNVVNGLQDDEQLFSEKFSCPVCGLSLPELEPRMFSFNSPLGACEACKGLGTIYKIDPETILNKRLTINEGAILPFNKLFFQDTWYIRLLKTACEEEGIDMNLAIERFDEDQFRTLLYGTKKIYKVQGTNRHGRETAIFEKFDGIVGELHRRFFENENANETFDKERYVREEPCTSCKGKRLKREILGVTIDGKNIAEFGNESVTEFNEYINRQMVKSLNTYEMEIAAGIIKEITMRLSFLNNVGLGYLTISRAAKSLSGGELQRIRLASQIGTGLTGVLYVLDEPSIGLHPKDVSSLISTLHNLKDLGNTLIIVEHDQETIESADFIAELGPRAGKHGGHVTFTGTVKDMLKSKKSITGQYISGKRTIRLEPRPIDTSKGEVILKGAAQYNLKNVNLRIPLGNLICITGVSGSGKSTLIGETLYPGLKYHLDGYYTDTMGDFKMLEGFQYLDRVYLVDQSPIGRTPRSNPATYIGFFDDIRELFANTQDAKVKGYKKGRFSFNLKGGRCEKCQGAGLIKIEMQFLPDIYVKCDVCSGQRYNKETLDVKYKEKNIYDILKMTIDEACDFFKNHHYIYQKLIFLQSVGLGYIELGQAAPTFSGGEAQRIKLAGELSRRDTGRTIYILDEPTTGLHFYDVEKLLHALNELVEKGNTVVIIEHNMDVIKNSQYIVDMGPEGGNGGGEIVYQGPIQDILKEPRSYTAKYLKSHL